MGTAPGSQTENIILNVVKVSIAAGELRLPGTQ
jgi:hypothetical protein